MKLTKYIKEPWLAVVAFDQHVLSVVPDSLYLRCYYKSVSGQDLNLRHPVTYCDKVNWLKIHDKNPLYGIMVDKLRVRDYIKKHYGSEYLIPLIAVYDSAEDIDLSMLPNSFVMKCNHDSGSVVICRNKDQFSNTELKERFALALKRSFGKKSRETAYSFIKDRRIIVEEYLYGDEDLAKKPDYKFFCFDGQVKMFQVNVGRTSASGTKVAFFDKEKHILPIREAAGYGIAENIILPDEIDLMMQLAERFSAHIPHVRVDFLLNKGKVYFSEFTFYHCGGFFPFSPDEWNSTVGSWIRLPKN